MTNAMTTTSAIQTAGKAKSKLSPRRKAYEIGMRTLLYVSAGATCLLLLFLIGYIFVEGMPNLTWEFLTTEESVLNDTVGILPAIQNTVYVVVVTLLFALPLGVGAAIYLTEYATNRKLVTAIEFATETLAGIPSILYALVGMLVFCQLMKLGTTLLAGSLTTEATSPSEIKQPWTRVGLPLPSGAKSISPRPTSFSAPWVSRIMRDSMAEATAKAMRLGMLAFMRPVITSAEGRWVAMTRCIPAARPI